MFAILFAMVLDDSDVELVARFKGGDQRAFATIVTRYQDRVYSLCLRWLSDASLAEEVAQDVFLALYRSLPRFRGDSKLSTWIYRVVVNHCKNKRTYRMRRKADRHEPLEGRRAEDEDAPQRQIAAEGPLPDTAMDETDAQRILRQSLAALDEGQRQVITLRDMEDLSYEEISEIMGVPRGTVKSRLHRARSSLAVEVQRRATEEDIF